ncbi:MAG: hypothetical protein U0414_36605 [Polyangiaceae bacterium]
MPMTLAAAPADPPQRFTPKTRRILAGAATLTVSAPVFVLAAGFALIAFYMAFVGTPAKPNEEASPTGVYAFLGLLGALPVALLGLVGSVFGALCIAGKRAGAIGGAITTGLAAVLVVGVAVLAELSPVAAGGAFTVLASVSALCFFAAAALRVPART